MNRGKLSLKALMFVSGIGLAAAALGGSQPAAAQGYSDESNCPAGTVDYPTYGCIQSGEAYEPYDYGYSGYLPYGAYGPYYGGNREFGHGFAHRMGGGFNHGVGFAHGGGAGFAHGMGGFGHGGGGGHR